MASDAPDADDLRFPVRPAYFQFDQQGVAFNMWYLAWFDEAVTEFMAAIGSPYEALLADGVDQQLVHAEIDWRTGVRYGDAVQVAVRTERVGTTSFTIGFAVHRTTDAGSEVTATGSVVYVTTGPGGTVAIPDAFRRALGSRLRPE